MKKPIIGLLFIVLLSFRADNKKLKVEGDLQTFQALMDCLENSNESHVKVEAVKKWILPQLQKQLSDSTKK